SRSLYSTSSAGIYTLSLHDALPILIGKDGWRRRQRGVLRQSRAPSFAAGTAEVGRDRTAYYGPLMPREATVWLRMEGAGVLIVRSEEHTSELQSRENLVCRLLLEKK